MKNTLKRLTAAFLLAALLASFVVPATFADAEPVQGATTVYDFDLSSSADEKLHDYNWDGVKLKNKPARTDGTTNDKSCIDLLAQFYADESCSLNWKYQSAKITGAKANESSFTAGKGLNTYIASGSENGYLALRLAAPAAGEGKYTVTLESYKTKSAVDPVDVYLVDAENFKDAETVIAAEEGKIFSNLTAVGTHETSEMVWLDGGEMILIINHTAFSKGYFGITRLTLTPEAGIVPEESSAQPSTEATKEATTEAATQPIAPSVPTVMNYDFDIASSTDAEVIKYAWTEQIRKQVKLADGSTDPVERNYMELLRTLYKNENCSVNWNVETHYNDTFKATFTSGTGITAGFGTYDSYGYLAFRLAAPIGGAGEYKAALEVTGTMLNTVDVYLLDASKYTNVAESMTEANLIFSGLNAADLYKTENALSLDGGEMILILKHTEKSSKNRFGIKSFRLIPAEMDLPEDEEPTTAPEVSEGATKDGFFDMELYHYEAFSGLKGIARSYDNKYAGGKIVRDVLEEAYPSNVNWILENTSGVVPVFRGDVNRGMVTKTDAGDWLAFRVNMTLSGTYNVTINSNYGGYSYISNVWVFPASSYTMTAAEIQAEMIDSNLVGKAVISDTSLSSKAGKYDFTAGEYIIVMDVDASRHCLSNITLTEYIPEVPKEPVDKLKYDFHLVGLDPTFPQKGIVNWADAEKTERVYARIARMYLEDTIQWKYEGVSSDTAPNATFMAKYMRFKATPDYIELGNTWNAFRVESPGAGTYDVRLNCVDSNSLVTSVYLIPAQTGVPMSNEEIEAGMTAENLLISKARIKGKGEFYLGEYTFGTEYEYVLVFKMVRGTRLNLINVELTKDGLRTDGKLPVGKNTPGVVYDLDLADEFDGIFYGENRFDIPDVFDRVQARWNSGAQNWKWEYASENLLGTTPETMHEPSALTRFYKTTGMRVYGNKDKWVALRIKSPGEGEFTISINHATSANDGTLAMYVLPGDTPKEDIWSETDPKNRVGKVVLTNQTGDTAIVDGSTSFVGYYNFEAGKEYILVLECYENSIYANTLCYLNISQIFMEKGRLDKNTENTEKQINPITVAKDVIKVADAGMQSAVTEVNGCDYYLVNLEGGTLLVYNLDTAELLDEADIGVGYGRCMAVAPDGKVWIAGDIKQLVCYDPETLSFEKSVSLPGALGYNFTYTNAITVDEAGMVYVTLSSTNVIKYNPETKEFTDFGRLLEGATYATAMTYHNGYLYVSYDAPEVYSYVVKYDLATNQMVGKTDIFPYANGAILRSLSILGDELMLCGSNEATEIALAIDIATMELVEVDLPGGINLGCTEEIDGKHYIVPQGYGLYEYDVATKTFSKCVGFGNGGTGFRTAGANSYGSSLVTIEGDRCLFTYTAGGAHPRLYNLDEKEYTTWDNLVYGVGGGSNLNTITVGPEGSYDVYIAGWNTDFGAIYNTEKGEITLQYETAGQSDSMQWYEGKFYVANYSSTTLNETYPETNEVIQRFKLDHELTGQLRPMAMTAGGGYVFVGTVPNSNVNGGAVTVYNTSTGEWHYARNVVPDQSIIGLAHNDGIVFCGSTRSGGQGAPMMGEAAMIAAYDYEKQEVLAILDLRDHIKGLADPVNYIYGLSADPNAAENGRIWGVVSDTLFCFTFDKETRTFQVQEVLSYNKTDHRTNNAANWKGENVEFDIERGYIYVLFRNTGGFRRIKLADWNAPIGQVQIESADRLMGYYALNHTLAEDGNLYFANGGDLLMLPLNVTDEDWAIAEEVDAMFQKIHDSEITLATESEIRTARSAYENLSWYYKALIQNLELLYEAESDVLECKIAAKLSSLTVDADAFEPLQELIDEYKTLNKRQQRYVKNYQELKAAYDLASDLNDERIATAMQERVNALKDLFPLTLDDEPQVLAVREDFDAMTGSQKLLVDAAILKDAEEQIAVLRVEFVKYVETLIQALPEVVTLEAEATIMEARAAVDKLYAPERKQVSFAKLDQAEFKLRTLLNGKAAAENVDMLIKNIGIVTLGDKARIAEARNAYRALDEVGRSFCTKANKLKRAEFILKALQTWGIPVIVVANAGVLFAVIWFVPSIHNKVFKTKKKEEVE